MELRGIEWQKRSRKQCGVMSQFLWWQLTILVVDGRYSNSHLGNLKKDEKMKLTNVNELALLMFSYKHVLTSRQQNYFSSSCANGENVSIKTSSGKKWSKTALASKLLWLKQWSHNWGFLWVMDWQLGQETSEIGVKIKLSWLRSWKCKIIAVYKYKWAL